LGAVEEQGAHIMTDEEDDPITVILDDGDDEQDTKELAGMAPEIAAVKDGIAFA
jgi:hypothetical protein